MITKDMTGTTTMTSDANELKDDETIRMMTETVAREIGTIEEIRLLVTEMIEEIRLPVTETIEEIQLLETEMMIEGEKEMQTTIKTIG